MKKSLLEALEAAIKGHFVGMTVNRNNFAEFQMQIEQSIVNEQLFKQVQENIAYDGTLTFLREMQVNNSVKSLAVYTATLINIDSAELAVLSVPLYFIPNEANDAFTVQVADTFDIDLQDELE